MKILLAHNEYGKFSGEEAVVARQTELLRARGHETFLFGRSSADIDRLRFGRARAFLSGIYNPFSRRAFLAALRDVGPDVVHVHNVFPLISPSILPACRRQDVPVVMTLHNYRLVCPNALLLRGGLPCHECLGGREWRCVRHNCEGGLAKSLGYALRTGVARRRRFFLDAVDVFIALSDFQKDIYVREGFPADRVLVAPNFLAADPADGGRAPPAGLGTFILYAGRVAPERDVPTLLAAAALCPEIPFRIAGSCWRMPHLPPQAAPNVAFLGEVGPEALSELYAECRALLLATRCYEGFPSVILEAMSHGKPAICPALGGLPEIVTDGVTGLLYEPGNAAALADRVRQLWRDPALGGRLGQAAREKLRSEYSADAFYERLMAAYARAQARHGRGPQASGGTQAA
jgi:glycosyltransferase involved in cell wall biosynthesis